MLSEKRIEQLKDAKEQVDILSALIGDILNGGITMAEGARRLGISPQQMGNEAGNGFLWQLHKIMPLSKSEMFSLLMEIRTPYEKLFYDIFGLHVRRDSLILLSEECESLLGKSIDEILNEQERYAIKRHYGIGCRKKAWEQIGKEFGISRTSAQNIAAKGMRKLRQPKVWNKVMSEYKVIAKTEAEISALEDRNIQYRKKVLGLMEECRHLQEESSQLAQGIKELEEIKAKLEEEGYASAALLAEKCRQLQEEGKALLADKKESETAKRLSGQEKLLASASPLPFDEMSKALENVLKRHAGVRTYKDLITGFTKDSIKNVYGMGKAHMAELESLLWENGYVLREK